MCTYRCFFGRFLSLEWPELFRACTFLFGEGSNLNRAKHGKILRNAFILSRLQQNFPGDAVNMIIREFADYSPRSAAIKIPISPINKPEIPLREIS
jgi:hypothetical protein